MKSISLLTSALLFLAAVGVEPASAQLPVEIKIPRPGRPKPKPAPTESAQPAPASEAQPAAKPQPAASTTAQPQAPAGPDGIAVMKNWVQFTTRHVTSYKGDYKTWSWTPVVRFDTTGPTPSGASYYAVVMQPNGAPWAELDCKWDGPYFECGGPNYPEDKATTASGVFPFSIKMRNPLAGTDVTLFSGKVKIDKAPATDVGTPAERARQLIYFTNQEWAMPIGYVFYYLVTNRLNIAFWVRGEEGSEDPHVFYRGKEVGVHIDPDAGIRVGKPSCSSKIQIRTSTSPADSVKPKPEWHLIECDFSNSIKIRDEGERFSIQPHYLSANPGEYEIKVLRKNKLARSIKFTVGPDGKLTSGIPLLYRVGESANQNAHGVIVPVAILDDQDGPWDKNAWRTDAFYGNPLTGFTPPQ